MNTSTAEARSVTTMQAAVSDDTLTVVLPDGRTISAPLIVNHACFTERAMNVAQSKTLNPEEHHEIHNTQEFSQELGDGGSGNGSGAWDAPDFDRWRAIERGARPE